MRSLLIAPADEKRLAEALKSGADGIVVDLACAAPAKRAGARAAAARFLIETRGRGAAPALIVRINALEFGRDRCRSRRGDDRRARRDPLARESSGPRAFNSFPPNSRCARLSSRSLTARPGSLPSPIRPSLYSACLPIAARARGLSASRGARSPRADIGAETDRDRLGDFFSPYRLARDLTLLAATAAGVAAIDGVFPNVRDLEGLRAETLAARRDGLPAKWRSTRLRPGSSTTSPPRSLPIEKQIRHSAGGSRPRR